MRFLTLATFIAFFLLNFSIQEGATKTIKGTIYSNKTPLSDVSVVLDGTKYFSITNKKGQFELEVPEYLWDEEIFIIFKCKGYEDNLVQFHAHKHFKKKLNVEMQDKFENAIKNFNPAHADTLEFNNVIQSKDISEEE